MLPVTLKIWWMYIVQMYNPAQRLVYEKHRIHAPWYILWYDEKGLYDVYVLTPL